MTPAADERSELEIIKIQSEQRRVALEYWVSEKSRANDALKKAKAENERLAARLAELEKGIVAVDALISESGGVYGLHLNGDDAPWSELQTGGRFEEWLRDFDAAKEGSGDE